ncbi:MAG TPA: ferritin-like domain-containing protein [Planctomycetota bacterium]|jgi:bacterioferritin|nr:ferritin-like domain-containing protein [Planctomycetota bacterium]
MQTKTDKIVAELIVAYWMEMETLQNYLAHSQNLDGVRAEEIKKALAADIPVELGHATQLAGRIRVLDGQVPGSLQFKATQRYLQPPAESTDVVSVIKGVIQAEEGAIEQYNQLIKLSDGIDYATQDLCIRILANEEDHRREFKGFLREYEKLR